MTTTTQGGPSCKYSRPLKRFKNNPNHYGLQLQVLAKMYGVPEQFVRTHFLPIAGRIPPHTAQRILAEKCRNHPMFGKPDERAPCTHKYLSKLTGVPSRTVSTLRRAAGVRGNNPVYDAGRRTGNLGYQLTRADKKMYALCALTRTWGRPVGVGELLADLRAS